VYGGVSCQGLIKENQYGISLLPQQLRHQLWNFLACLPTMRSYKSEATPILCGGQPYNFLEHVTKCTVVPVSDHGGDLFYGMS